MQVYVPKLKKSVEVDFDSFTQGVQSAVIEYGLKQKLNDCISGEKDPEKMESTVAAMIDQLASGVWAASGGGRPADELTKETLATLVRAYRKAGVKAGDARDHAAAIREAVESGSADDATLVAWDKAQKAAKKVLAARTEPELDLPPM